MVGAALGPGGGLDDRGRGRLFARHLRPPSRLIVTVTPNPSIDRTLRIPPLERGAMIRAASATAEAGGKGINVSRALATEGVETLAIVPLSEASAAVMTGLLGWQCRSSPSRSPARSASTSAWSRPMARSPRSTSRARRCEMWTSGPSSIALRSWANGAAWVVGCGSLPPGAPVRPVRPARRAVRVEYRWRSMRTGRRSGLHR